MVLQKNLISYRINIDRTDKNALNRTKTKMFKSLDLLPEKIEVLVLKIIIIIIPIIIFMLFQCEDVWISVLRVTVKQWRFYEDG